jgi:oxaloacetate decarboxylase beta subunit
MITFKRDPIWVTKICILLVLGAMVLSVAMSVFNAPAQAQTASDVGSVTGRNAPASFLNPEGIILGSDKIEDIDIPKFARKIAETTGLYAFIHDAKKLLTPSGETTWVFGWKELIMVIVGFVIVWLGAGKGFEPLLLIPIGFGVIFVNVPFAGIGDPGVWNEAEHIFEHQGFLDIIYKGGVGNEFFPLFIFMGIGAMTDRKSVV